MNYCYGGFLELYKLRIVFKESLVVFDIIVSQKYSK